MSDSENARWIVKGNELVNASYNLTLVEQRIVSMLLESVDSMDRIDKDNAYEITSVSYAERYADQYKNGGGRAYRDLSSGMARLYDRSVRMDYSYSRVDREQTRWISGYTEENDGDEIREPRKGVFKVTIAPSIRRHISLLRGEFTRYRLAETLAFRRPHSYRVYELLKQWENVGKFEIDPEELKEKLGVHGKYRLFSELRRYVLEPTHKEITESTPMRYEMDYERVNKRVVKIVFNIAKSKERPSGKQPG